jgi:hypothetical protein
MSKLVKDQRCFLKLFLFTSQAQRKGLINTMSPLQMEAIVQVVYNALQGIIKVNEQDKSRLQKSRLLIRRFVARGVSHLQRKRWLLKHVNHFLLLLRPIEKETWFKN